MRARGRELDEGAVGDGEGRDEEAHGQEREQTHALAGPVEVGRRGDLEEGGEVTQDGVAGHGEDDEQPRFVDAQVPEGEGGGPGQDEQGREQVHAQQHDAVDLGLPSDPTAPEQGAEVADQRLVVSACPADHLLHALGPGLGHLLVALAAVLVDRLPASEQQAEGRVGVLGQAADVPAADGLEGRLADPPDGPSVLRDEIEIHPGLLVDLVAPRALEIQQAGQQVVSGVDRDHAPHHRADLGVEEGGDELLQETASRQVVGVEDQDDVGAHKGHRIGEGRGLARRTRAAVEGLHEIRMTAGVEIQEFAGAVGGAVVDHEDAQAVAGIVDHQQGVEDAGQDDLFVVGGHEDRDLGPVGGPDVEVGEALPSEEPVQGEGVVAHEVEADEPHHHAEEDPLHFDVDRMFQGPTFRVACAKGSHCQSFPPWGSLAESAGGRREGEGSPSPWWSGRARNGAALRGARPWREGRHGPGRVRTRPGAQRESFVPGAKLVSNSRPVQASKARFCSGVGSSSGTISSSPIGSRPNSISPSTSRSRRKAVHRARSPGRWSPRRFSRSRPTR